MRTMQKTYQPFTAEMKAAGYTILVPNMLPMHFRLLLRIFGHYGYNMELLTTTGRHISDTGLKYVHNDTCYPAILVIGQFIDALQSGKYDPHKVALMLFQTGGGCRASNYISLLRKALEKAGYGYVPVISFSFAGIEKHPGFRLTLPMIYHMLYAVLYADLLMTLVNQVRPYEERAGESEELAEAWTDRLADELAAAKGLQGRRARQNIAAMLMDFARIPRRQEKRVKVGVVGEIYVKYSPLGNNDLEAFLLGEGAEVVVPGLLDFCMYSVYSVSRSGRLDLRWLLSHFNSLAYRYLRGKKKMLIDLMRKEGTFDPPTPFDHTVSLTRGVIGLGVKMGEGWLLTAEMLELYEKGVHNIVCTQPFGCLPNHVCGKGMMKPIKDRHPDINIVAIDYDAGATRVNQVNRLKLMLANARMNEREAAGPREAAKTAKQSPSVA